jgi:hypothetical protein
MTNYKQLYTALLADMQLLANEIVSMTMDNNTEENIDV